MLRGGVGLRLLARLAAFAADDGGEDAVKESEEFGRGDECRHESCIVLELIFAGRGFERAGVPSAPFFGGYFDEKCCFSRFCHCNKFLKPCCFGGL